MRCLFPPFRERNRKQRKKERSDPLLFSFFSPPPNTRPAPRRRLARRLGCCPPHRGEVYPLPLSPSAGLGGKLSPTGRHTLRLQPLGGCGTGSSPLFGRRPPTPQIFPVRCAGSGELQSRRRQHRTAEMASKACTHHRPAPSRSAKKPGAGALGSFGRCYSVLGRGRALILWRLTPRVDRLWSMAEVAGGSSPRTPRAMRHPLKPRTNR